MEPRQPINPGDSERPGTHGLGASDMTDEARKREAKGARTTTIEDDIRPLHKDEGEDLRDRAAGRVDKAAHKMREKVGEAADNVRTRLADEVRVFGAAAGAASEQLREDDHARVGRYVRGLETGCEAAAGYIEECDLDDIQEDAAHIARRSPALFLAGLAVAGFAIGRVLSAKPVSSVRGRTHGTPATPGSPMGTHTTPPRATPAGATTTF